MRLSVKKGDPAYHPKGIYANVFVDGVEVPLCYTADEELGVAYCYAVDEAGDPVVDPQNPGTLKLKEYRGAVNIVVKDGL